MSRLTAPTRRAFVQSLLAASAAIALASDRVREREVPIWIGHC